MTVATSAKTNASGIHRSVHAVSGGRIARPVPLDRLLNLKASLLRGRWAGRFQVLVVPRDDAVEAVEVLLFPSRGSRGQTTKSVATP